MCWLKQWAISCALRKKSPNRIPTSDLAAMRLRNYYTVYLRDENGAIKFAITDRQKSKYIAIEFSENSKEDGKSINRKELCKYNLYIIHYYGEVEICYNSSIMFFIASILKAAFFKLRFDRLSRFIYGSVPLSRKSRIEILRYAIEQGINYEQKINVMGLLTAIHGNRLRYVDKQWPLYLYYKALLDSLDGELKRDNNTDSYSVNPSAITTLDRYESEERRHRQAIRTQMQIVVLTFVIAVTGLAPHGKEISEVAVAQYSRVSNSLSTALHAIAGYFDFRS